MGYTHSFDIRIAAAYGLEEAIIIDKIDFWLYANAVKNKNFHDGTYWTTFSATYLLKEFYYLRSTGKKADRKVQYLLTRLTEKCVIQVQKIGHQHSWDKSNSYTFTDAFLQSSIEDECGVEIPVAHMLRFCTISKSGGAGEPKTPKTPMAQNCTIEGTKTEHRTPKKVPSLSISKTSAKTEEEYTTFFSTLKSQIGDNGNYATWIVPVQFTITGNVLDVAVPEEFFIGWLKNHYETALIDAAKQQTRLPDVQIRYRVAEQEENA